VIASVSHRNILLSTDCAGRGMVEMKKDYPGWRSLLFIPTHIEKFVAKAHTRGADAYILDLEDSVPLAQKTSARALVASAATKVTVDGADALVRINLDDSLAKADLVEAVDLAVSAIVIPKVESAEQVQRIAGDVNRIEQDKGLPGNHTGLIAMIESVEGLAKLDEIAGASQRLLALTLGSEDFSASARMQPSQESLLYPNQLLQFACRRAGIAPLGFPASIADFSDIDKFRATIRFARQLGFVGAFCIHPKQAEILNEQLTPSAEEIDRAGRLIAAYEEGVKAGKGAVEFEGKMIDYPVVINARELLNSYASLRDKGRLSQ
jgi:citrate lyase subunit beta / citryl-CoA lyase